MLDKLITAINRLNHGATILLLFAMGVLTAIVGYLLVAWFPHVDHDIEKGMAALGGIIVAGAMMAFRSGSDSSETNVDEDGKTRTKQASVSGDPAPPAI
jgi:hypothetical protein